MAPRGRFSRLSAQLGDGLDALRVIAEEVAAARHDLEGQQPSRLELSGLAHQVGLFYTAVEDLLAHVALVFDEEVPRGEHWHRELLRGAALELPGLRPAVLGADLTNELDEYRRFRHRIRHVYLPPVPDWHKMAHLVDRLADVHGELDRQVRQFIAFLQHLAGST